MVGRDGGEGVPVRDGAGRNRPHRDTVDQYAEHVIAGRRGDREGRRGAVVDGLHGGRADGAVGPCAGRDRVLIDGEVGGDAVIGRHATVRAGGGGHAVAPVDEVVAGGGRAGRHRCATASVADRLRRRARDRAVRAGRIGEREGVDGEVGGDGLVRVHDYR